MSIPQPRSKVAVLTAGEWLAPLARHWVNAAYTLLSLHAAVVRVTVIALRGSAPREPGASMLVDAFGTVGSIGGGQLEWQATRMARELLCARDAAAARMEDLILGPDLGQCCGGRVELWLERLTRDDLPWLLEAVRCGKAPIPSFAIVTEFRGGIASHRLQRSTPGAVGLHVQRAANDAVTLYETLTPQRPPLWIFGAGHVGQALVRLLSELALFEISWIDSRPELLPADLADGVTAQACASPVDLVGIALPGTRYVVLTHDHALDYNLCRSILRRGDSSWLGLIGSASKSARFRSRLRRDGVSGETLSGLTCPIGIPGIASKLPASIAIAIAAQLLQQAGTVPARATATTDTEDPACSATCGACGSERRTKT